MKKLAFFFFSLLFVFVLYNFWWSSNWYANITTQMSSSTNCGQGASNCMEFTAYNIPNNPDIYNVNQPYRYEWFYSDGTYGFGTLAAQQSNNTLTSTHDFPSGTDNNALLQLVPTYDDKDKPKQFSIFSNPLTDFTPGTPKLLTTGQNIHLENFHTPRRGDSMVYVFQYGNTFGGTTEGFAKFMFNTDAMDIKAVYTFNGQSFTPQDLANANASGELKINYGGLDNNEFRNVFVLIHFPEDADESIEEVSFPLELYAKVNADNIQTIVDTIFLQYLTPDRPHDPNYITADKPEICPDPIPDSLIYTIVFQNIGTDSCQVVTVKNILPINFLLDATGKYIQTIDPPGLKHKVNMKTREITWCLTNKDSLKFDKKTEKGCALRGTNEDDKEYFTVDDTKDSIVFRVLFDKSIPLVPCSAIPNRAEIIFEDLEMIVTNDFFTHIQCTNCDSCTTTPGIEVLPAVTTQKGKAVTLQLPANKTQFATHFSWYPPLANSASPNASPDSTTIYTAVASGGCRKEIFQIKVKVEENQKCKGFWPCLWHCKWWLLLIILALIAWLLLRRRRDDV